MCALHQSPITMTLHVHSLFSPTSAVHRLGTSHEIFVSDKLDLTDIINPARPCWPHSSRGETLARASRI